MKTRSRYYNWFQPLSPEDHQWRMRYWGRELPPTYGGLSMELNARGKALFQAAVERFGPAYEGGCFCALMRGWRCWQDDWDPYTCGFYGTGNWYLQTFDHGTFFQRRGEAINAVVGQPYGYYDADHGPRLREFCAERGLEMEVGESWQYPGRATALIFTHAGAPLREGDQELESEIASYIARQGGEIQSESLFVEVLWSHIRERGHEVCAVCDQTLRQHAIDALNFSPAPLPHPFVGSEAL